MQTHHHLAELAQACGAVRRVERERAVRDRKRIVEPTGVDQLDGEPVEHLDVAWKRPFDASEPPARQDFGVAALAVEEGRALVIALNKWDLLTEKTDRTFDEVVAIARDASARTRRCLRPGVSRSARVNLLSSSKKASRAFNRGTLRPQTGRIGQVLVSRLKHSRSSSVGSAARTTSPRRATDTDWACVASGHRPPRG